MFDWTTLTVFIQGVMILLLLVANLSLWRANQKMWQANRTMWKANNSLHEAIRTWQDTAQKWQQTAQGYQALVANLPQRDPLAAYEAHEAQRDAAAEDGVDKLDADTCGGASA